MMKLLRKYLSEQKLRHKNDDLDWKLLKNLAEMQASENFSMTNKLTKDHIHWQDHKMNVKKAVQIFSDENADALEQLGEDFYDGYDSDGCRKLVKFLRLCNNMLDIMNHGEGKKSNDHFKQPVSSSTITKFRKLFESFKQFTSEMTIEVKRGKKIKRESVAKQMGFASLLINIESTIGIYESYVKDSSSGIFYTFQYGQDHLETYFSLVRGSLGGNNNPNVEHFMAAYRKLLFCSPHISGERTNCNVELPNQLLTVSSEVYVPRNYETILKAQTFEIDFDIDAFLNMELQPYYSHMYALAASDVEKEFIRKFCNGSACKDCLNVFVENQHISDSLICKQIARGVPKVQPCTSTYNIVVACSEICKILEGIGPISFESTLKIISEQFTMMPDPMYASSQFELHQCRGNETKTAPFTHEQDFILKVIDIILQMKSKNICSRISMEELEEARKRRSDRRARILAGK